MVCASLEPLAIDAIHPNTTIEKTIDSNAPIGPDAT